MTLAKTSLLSSSKLDPPALAILEDLVILLLLPRLAAATRFFFVRESDTNLSALEDELPFLTCDVVDEEVAIKEAILKCCSCLVALLLLAIISSPPFLDVDLLIFSFKRSNPENSESEEVVEAESESFSDSVSESKCGSIMALSS